MRSGHDASTFNCIQSGAYAYNIDNNSERPFLKRRQPAIRTAIGKRYIRTANPGSGHMRYEAINFGKKFKLFDEQWQPKVIAEMNDYQFKVVKLQGDFVWHDHKDTDETFVVLDGVLRIDFRDGAVEVSAGEMFVVLKGVEHKPYAEHEVKLLLIEPRGVLNTGHEGGDRTAENDVWI